MQTINPNLHLSKDFRLVEFTRSSTADRLEIDNTPPQYVIDNLVWLCYYILQPARTTIKRIIHINSGYRCEKLNKAVGGRPNSLHLQGRAADIHVKNIEDAKELAPIFARQEFCDLVIIEHIADKFWLHVQMDKIKPRHLITYA